MAGSGRQKKLRYCFEAALTPNTFWVDFKNIDFGESTGAKVLRMDDGQTYAGEVSDNSLRLNRFSFRVCKRSIWLV